jgi:hypothetical protein
MPSTPYAKLLCALNAGAPAHGGITAANGDTVQFTAESTAQWDLTTPPRWEIYAYPPGWTGPGTAGWVTESVPSPFGGTSDVYVYTGLGPPTAFVLPALPMWGDFLCKLTVAGGLLNGLPAAQLVDNATALRIVGPGGLKDIAVSAENQFDTGRAWVGSWQDDLRILDAAVVGAATPYAALPEPIEIGAGSAGAVLQYAHGDHSHPVVVGAPTAIAIGDVAAAGAGTALAGAAHVHALPVPTVISAVTAAAGSLGASTAVAREDHAHQVSTAAPVDVGIANAAGAANTLVRSDHVHALSFATVNTILAGASAPITINGQTLTSGGFIGPYFSSNALIPATSGLLRAATRTDAVVFRNELDTGDIIAVSMDSTGVDDLLFGSSAAASNTINVGVGNQIRFNSGGIFLRFTTASGIAFSNTATFAMTQDVSTGAGAAGTIRAQGGAAGFAGGTLVLSAGAPGAGGSATGIDLDIEDNVTVSGSLSIKAGALGTILVVQYDSGTGFTTIGISPDDALIEAKELVLDLENAALFATTNGSYAGGVGVLQWTNATTEPTGDAADGPLCWGFGDALKTKTETLVVLAPKVESAPGAEDLRAPDRRAARITTTNATPTDAYTFVMPDEAVAFFRVEVLAFRAADGTSAVYELKAGVKANAGVASLVGAVDVFAREDNAALDATIAVDGTLNVYVVITGIAAQTFEWFVTPNVTLMQPA